MELGKPILVTGASGKTGQRAVAAIAKKGGKVRAFVRRPEAGAALQQAGAAEIAVGDLLDHEFIAACDDRRGAGAAHLPADASTGGCDRAHHDRPCR